MVDSAWKMRGGSLAEVRYQAGAWEQDYGGGHYDYDPAWVSARGGLDPPYS